MQVKLVVFSVFVLLIAALVIATVCLAAPPATANVVLRYFKATSFDGEVAVYVDWATASEIDVFGFYVNRSLSATGVFTHVNEQPIPAMGDLTGYVYPTLIDDDVQLGTTYYYQLEVVNNDQSRQYSAIVSVIAGQSSQSPCGTVSCTVYLPLIFKPVPLAPAQFEVTQGIQQPNNSVLLVGNRLTYVRWTLTSTVAYTSVNALLYGYRNNAPLPSSPISALNNPRTLKAAADRGVLNDTFNFRLPDSWASGDVLLNAQAANSTGFFTQTMPASFHFNPSAALPVKVVPIEYYCTNSSGVTPPGDPPYTYLTAYTYRVYPVPSINSSTHATIRYDGPCTNNLPDPAIDDWETMLYNVTAVWQSEGSPDVYYYGLLKVYCGGGCVSGIGWIGQMVAVGFDGLGASHSESSETHAHEVGHNHGRYHAPGCGADGPDPSFPYVQAGSGRIGDSAHLNYGFNVDTQAIYVYSTYELMSYCGPAWVSDYTYTALWSFDNTLRSVRPTLGDQAWLISGSIDPHANRATLDPAYAIDLPARSPERGDYVLEMLDQADRVVAAYPFAPSHAQSDRLKSRSSNNETIGFHLTLPYRADVTTLRVRHNDRVIGELQASAAAPRLIAIARSGRLSPTNQIRWIGYDVNGSPLSYLVRASTDQGKTWQTIGVNLTQPTISLNPIDFGGHNVLIEVLGSSGLQTTQLQIGPYFVAKK
jgi:hypothetical protein